MESRLKTDIESQKWEPAESEFKPTIKSNSQKAKFNQNLERVIKIVIKKKNSNQNCHQNQKSKSRPRAYPIGEGKAEWFQSANGKWRTRGGKKPPWYFLVGCCKQLPTMGKVAPGLEKSSRLDCWSLWQTKTAARSETSRGGIRFTKKWLLPSDKVPR